MPAGANIFRAEPSGAPRTGQGTVEIEGFVRVVDGETIDAWINGQRVGITLSGLEAPQANTACGRRAAAALRGLLESGVVLEDDTGAAFDARGRRVYRALTRGERKPVAREMIAAGVAYADGKGKAARENGDAQARARNDRLGCLHGGRSAQEEAAAPAPEPSGPLRSATGLPSGFFEDVLAAGFDQPTAMALLPDGRILVAEKGGLVRLYKNGQVQPTPFLDLRDRVNDYYDRGLIGIAADPNFLSNGHVYLLYVYENDPTDWSGPKTARLTRVTASGDAASPSSEVVVLGRNVGKRCAQFPAGADCIPSEADSHSVGSVRFADDGSLFVTVGDAASFNLVNDDALRAQSLDSLAGKVLRIDRSGAGLPDNPFWNGDPSAARSKVWALGVRNAYRFAVKPGTTVPFLGDVGWGEWEEVDAAPRGANLGWPCYEGDARQGGYGSKPACQSLYALGASAVTAPLTSYAHGGGSAAVTGGVFYRGTAYPPEFQGAFFYGDYVSGWIKYLKVDAQNRLAAGPFAFATDADGPVAIDVGADGTLYYLAINKGELRRIASGAPPPTTCTRGAVGSFSVDYFANRTLSGAPVFSGCELTIDHAWELGGPGNGVPNDNFSARWRGRFNFAGGDMTFVAAADDGVRVYVDGQVIIDAWFDQPVTTYRATRTLTAGEHDVVMEYFENGGGAHAALRWQNTQPSSCPTGQYLAEFFPNRDLAGEPLWTRCEPRLSHDWGAVGPGNGIADDDFSVRWTGRFAMAEGGHTFTADWDDGLRLYLDGQALVDAWTSGPGHAQVARTLAAGEHAVRVEFFEQGGAARASVAWQAANPNQPPVATISSPTQSMRYRVGENVAFSGSAADPEDGAVPPERLSWSVVIHHCPGGQCHTHPFKSAVGAGGSFVVPDHGDDSYFEITLTAADSLGATTTASRAVQPLTARLTLNSSPPGRQLLYVGTTVTAPYSRDVVVGAVRTVGAPSPQGQWSFRSWSDGGAQQHDVSIGGELVLTASFADGTGQATPTPPPTPTRTPLPAATPTPTATAVAPSSCPSGQFRAEYFAGRWLSGTPVLTRCEATIAYDWGSGGPGNGLGNDNYSIRWTGRLRLTAGDHVFTATADDGVRLWVDRALIVDAWRDQPATAYEARRSLAAGDHDVVMEYYENGGGAAARLTWRAVTGQTGCPTGQFTAEYFNNRTLTGAPVFTRCEAGIAYDWGSGGPGNGIGTNNFSIRWTGRFAFAAGSRTFRATADDGVRLYVDGQRIIDAWRDQAVTTHQATRVLSAGEHEVKMEYYENSGVATARLSW